MLNQIGVVSFLSCFFLLLGAGQSLWAKAIDRSILVPEFPVFEQTTPESPKAHGLWKNDFNKKASPPAVLLQKASLTKGLPEEYEGSRAGFPVLPKKRLDALHKILLQLSEEKTARLLILERVYQKAHDRDPHASIAALQEGIAIRRFLVENQVASHRIMIQTQILPYKDENMTHRVDLIIRP